MIARWVPQINSVPARLGSDRLLADVRSDKICHWRLDRLNRTTKGLLTPVDELKSLRFGFVSLREVFDITTHAGRLMAGVLALVASYEIEVRIELRLAGIAKAKSDGKVRGGRKAGTRIKLTDEKEVTIPQLHQQCQSVAAIARTVGLTRKTIYRALGRELIGG